MADNSNDPGPLEVAEALSIAGATLINLKANNLITDANIAKANEVLSDLLDKLKEGVSKINFGSDQDSSSQAPLPEPKP